ncbi:META domain-containing protein [Flavobacteriaceae bacterium MAR_2009_75]|nr:META domain-containing protein [Flavobacteriaceae bacterium MAR_2009_75]
MKIKYIILIIPIILFSCKSQNKIPNIDFYNATWELEYISGPRIAFKALYPNKKPIINFNSENNTVVGNSSCNGYSAPFNLNGNALSFGEPGPSTLMYCGEGEKVFLNMMKKINAYSFDEAGKLQLLMNEVPVMRFNKAN